MPLPVNRQSGVGEGRGSVAAPEASTKRSSSTLGAMWSQPFLRQGDDPKRGDSCVRRPLLVPPPAELGEKAAFRMRASGRQGSLRGLHRPNGATSRRPGAGGCSGSAVPQNSLGPSCRLSRASSLAAHARRPRGNTARRGESDRLPPATSCACSALTVAQSQGRLSPTTGGVTGRAGSTVWRR